VIALVGGIVVKVINHEGVVIAEFDTAFESQFANGLGHLAVAGNQDVVAIIDEVQDGIDGEGAKLFRCWGGDVSQCNLSGIVH
jgi:hypothetical protein